MNRKMRDTTQATAYDPVLCRSAGFDGYTTGSCRNRKNSRMRTSASEQRFKRNSRHTQHMQSSQLSEPIDIPWHYTVSFKISIPRKEMSQQLRKMKALELEVLDSTISPEARKILAETVEKAPREELDLEIKKIILEVLGKKKRGFLGRW